MTVPVISLLKKSSRKFITAHFKTIVKDIVTHTHTHTHTHTRARVCVGGGMYF